MLVVDECCLFLLSCFCCCVCAVFVAPRSSSCLLCLCEGLLLLSFAVVWYLLFTFAVSYCLLSFVDVCELLVVCCLW